VDSLFGGAPASPQAGSKRLILLRHAKSSWEHDVPDHDRPLSARGQRDAVAVGRLLAARRLVVDLVVCSTALRTRQTWDGAVLGGADAREVRYLSEIYDASVPDLLQVVHPIPESATTSLVLGHGPGVPELLEYVAVPRDNAAWARLDAKFPTAGLATVTFSGRWADLGPGAAELDAFDVPRGKEENGALDDQSEPRRA
jgi:phosphohistidine phosphatase